MQILKIKTNDKGKELLRFFIIGVSTTIIDFIFYSLTSFLLRKSGFNIAIWVTVISSIIGFLTGTIFNYFFSYLWVYQNFDKSKYKEHQKTHVLMFFVLSIIGMLIGVAIMTIFKVSYSYGLNIDIDTWSNVDIPSDLAIFPKIGFFIKMCLCSPTFWLFASTFCLKTIATLVFNYYSRKKFLFVQQKTINKTSNEKLISIQKAELSDSEALKIKKVFMICTIFAIYFLVTLVCLADYRLIKYDESRHAVSAYEMIINNNYIVNTYLGEPDYWNLKPVLAFYYLVISYKLFGYNSFATRFPSVIAGFIILAIILRILSKKYNFKYAVFGAILFLSTYFFFQDHSFKTGDPEAMYLLTFVLAVVCLYKSQKHKSFYILFFFAASLAFLIKSFHALIIPAFGLFYYILVKDFKHIKWWIYPFAITAFIILPLGWAYMRYQYDGTKFFEEMAKDLFNRGGQQIEGHTGTIFFYFGRMFASPAFSLLIIVIIIYFAIYIKNKTLKQNIKKSFLSIKKNILNESHYWRKLLLSSFLSVFIMYSFVISSKLQWYIYPCLILLCLMLPSFCAKTKAHDYLKSNKKILISFYAINIIAFIGITIGNAVSTAFLVTNHDYDSYQLKTVELIESLDDNLCKNRSIYNGNGLWSQEIVFYVELKKLKPHEGDATCHDADINSLIVVDRKIKHEYFNAHHNDVLIVENDTVFIAKN